MKWKLFLSSQILDKKHNIIFRRNFGFDPNNPDPTNDPKYKFFTKDAKTYEVSHWIPTINYIDLEYTPALSIPHFNYLYALAYDDNNKATDVDYCFFITDYQIVSARTIRYYLEPDDFQNYFCLKNNGATKYIMGTCIQTNDTSILSNTDKYHIIDPKPINGEKIQQILTSQLLNYTAVICYKSQTGAGISILADFTNDQTRVNSIRFDTLDGAIDKINQFSKQTSLKEYVWTYIKDSDSYEYRNDGTEQNIEVFDAYILPSAMFNLKTYSSNKTTIYKFGDLNALTVFEFKNVGDSSQELEINTENFVYKKCAVGTNMHRIDLNPLYKNTKIRLYKQTAQGQLKIQMSYNGQTIDITDDFEIPIIFSSAAQSYAQQSIFRAINALKGTIGIGGGIIQGSPLGVMTSMVDLAESFIPPQSVMQVEGNANGALNNIVCGGLGLFYFDSINEENVTKSEQTYGYNILKITEFYNTVEESENNNYFWYMFNNAQYATAHDTPLAIRQRIEQLFNNGIFIGKCYEIT